MARKKKLVTSRAVLGVLGTGYSLTEAKDNARERIVRAFSENENYQPETLWHAGYFAVMFRTLAGWGYQLVQHPDEEFRPGLDKLWGSSGCGMSYEDCKRQMLRHVADLGFTPGDRIGEPPAFVTNETDRAEMVKGWRWQNYIVEAREAHGIEDTEACRHYADLKAGRGGFGGQHLAPELRARVEELARRAPTAEDTYVRCRKCGAEWVAYSVQEGGGCNDCGGAVTPCTEDDNVCIRVEQARGMGAAA